MPAKKKSIYALHPGFAMEQNVIANLKNKTGRSFAEWKKLLRAKGPRDTQGWGAWLKAHHGLGTNTARFVAERAAGVGHEYEPEAYVEAMFKGSRAELRPIYDAILRYSLKLGKDVTVTPCKTIIPLRRRYVFAQFKPVSNTKVELGLALGTALTSEPVLPTGGLAKGDRITHKITIASARDFGTDAKKWLKRAYELCPPAEKS